MKQFKIYTIGYTESIELENQMKWRISIENLIKNKSDANITFIHSPLYCNYHTNEFKDKEEEKTWRLNQILDSDIVIVNLENIDYCIESYYELGYIEAVNSIASKHIYVIGVGKISDNSYYLSPTLFRHEETFEDAAEYISSYLLL